MSLSTFTLTAVISFSILFSASRNTKPSFSIEEGTELSLACTSLSVCPKPAMSELVFSTLKYLALCWSCEEEKVFLVMLLLGQEGGLGRVQLCLEEVDMFYPTIGWEEALSVTPGVAADTQDDNTNANLASFEITQP